MRRIQENGELMRRTATVENSHIRDHVIKSAQGDLAENTGEMAEMGMGVTCMELGNG